MIDTYFIFYDGDKEAIDSLTSNYLDRPTLEYVESTKNPTQWMSRAIAYSLLFYVLRELYSFKKFTLQRDENRKPHVTLEDGRKINVSLSHDGGAAAVSVSDGLLPIGVDLQRECEIRHREQLAARYFPTGEFSPNGEINIRTAALSSDGRIYLTDTQKSTRKAEKNATPGSFCAKWSLYEAMVKCDGRGIGAQGVSGDKFSLSYAKISVGESVYHIATAEEKIKNEE